MTSPTSLPPTSPPAAVPVFPPTNMPDPELVAAGAVALPAPTTPTYAPDAVVSLTAEDLGTLIDIKHTVVQRKQDELSAAQREVETVQRLINLAGQGGRVVAHPST